MVHDIVKSWRYEGHTARGMKGILLNTAADLRKFLLDFFGFFMLCN